MDWSWKGSLSGRICPRDGHDWWWQALGMDKAFWKSNTKKYYCMQQYITLSPLIMVQWENHPTRKETIILEIHPIFSTEKTMIMGERVAYVAFSLFQIVYSHSWRNLRNPVSTKRRWVFFPLKLRWNPDTMTRSLVTRYFGEVVWVEKGPKNDRELRR